MFCWTHVRLTGAVEQQLCQMGGARENSTGQGVQAATERSPRMRRLKIERCDEGGRSIFERRVLGFKCQTEV